MQYHQPKPVTEVDTSVLVDYPPSVDKSQMSYFYGRSPKKILPVLSNITVTTFFLTSLFFIHLPLTSYKSELY